MIGNEVNLTRRRRFLPPGTVVNVPAYTLHRDPANFWPLPNTFWPDRWLPSALRKPPSPTLLESEKDQNQVDLQTDSHFDLENVTTNLSAFIPFSSGPANCAGKNLALLEMRTVLSLIIRRFEISFGDNSSKPYDPKNWDEEGEDWFVFKNSKLPVKLLCRNV